MKIDMVFPLFSSHFFRLTNFPINIFKRIPRGLSFITPFLPITLNPKIIQETFTNPSIRVTAKRLAEDMTLDSIKKITESEPTSLTLSIVKEYAIKIRDGGGNIGKHRRELLKLAHPDKSPHAVEYFEVINNEIGKDSLKSHESSSTDSPSSNHYTSILLAIIVSQFYRLIINYFFNRYESNT